MTDPITIGNGVNKWVKDTNTKVVTLYGDTSFASGTYPSMIEAGTASTKYIVPVGKKFIILNIFSSIDMSHGYFTYNTTPDVSGGTQITTLLADVAMNAYIEIAAGNYLNCYENANNICIVVGVETNT